VSVGSAKQCLKSIDVLVLAGGLGTRVRRILGDTPKLLAPLAGRTYLDHLLDWLAQFAASHVVLALGHCAAAIVEHLAQRGPGAIKIETVIEPQPLGTAGAIRLARPRLGSNPVLVLNGDSFADVDLCRFYEYHSRSGAAVTILCATVADAGRYGRVEVDRCGAVFGFAEKDSSFRGAALVNAGMYFVSAGFLDGIATSTATSLESDVFGVMPPGSLAAFTECGNFIDIGTPESLALADAFFGKTALKIRIGPE
jgi:NDP-sugar pyrophosphorylase family protein